MHVDKENNMAAINHQVTEQELKEIHDAVYGLEIAKGVSDTAAHRIANDFSWGVFRNIYDYESVICWIVSKARQVFTVPEEKGHGII